jgi:hypothetical protein
MGRVGASMMFCGGILENSRGGAYTPPPAWEPIAHPSLMGYWLLDGDLTDSSGRGHTGTPVGAPVATAGRNSMQCYSFDGNDDWISVADHADFNLSTDFTMACWANMATLSQDPWWTGSFMGSDYQPGAKFIFAYDVSTSRIVFHSQISGLEVYSSVLSVTATSWHHFAISKVGSTLYFFLDGAAVGSVSVGAFSMPVVNQPFTIGWTEGNGGFEGLLQDVQVYDMGFAESDILRISQGLAPLAQP